MVDPTRLPLELHGVVTGSGSPMVLLHGVGMSHHAWDPVVARLAAHHEVLALDAPGHGDSPGMPAGQRFDAATLAGYVADELDRRGWDRVHVVGNSMGGRTALRLGALGRALSVTAISPGGGAGRLGTAWASGQIHQSARLIPLLLRHPAVVRPLPVRALATLITNGRPGQVSPEVLLAMGEAFAGSQVLRALDDVVGDRLDSLGRIDCPVTILWGSRDRLLWPAQRHAFSRVLPHARVVVLPGLGHVPMADDPLLVAEAVLASARQPAA